MVELAANMVESAEDVLTTQDLQLARDVFRTLGMREEYLSGITGGLRSREFGCAIVKRIIKSKVTK